MRYLFGLILLSVHLLAATPAHAERRVALVVGNAAYEHATRLGNPVNDATDVKTKLEKLGFDVTLATDQSSDKFFDAVQAFSNKLQGADLALFYYSGHGVQFDGANYLVPVDTRIEGAFALKRKAVLAQDVVEQMERGAKVSLVFLDACRNNTLLRDLEQSLPQQSRTMAANRGLARMDAKGSNTLIVFATAPNDVAADGTGQRNCPFTSALLNHIEAPGVVVQEMLTDVTAEVERTTNGRQKPEVLLRLTSKVRLAAVAPVPPPVIVVPPPVVPSKEREASVAWEAVKDTCERDRLAVFRERYGETFFGDLAKRLAEAIEANTVCALPVVAMAEPVTPVVAAAPPPVVIETPIPAPQVVAPTPVIAASVQQVAPPHAPKRDLDDEAFVRALQTELKRVGCLTSNVDGKWGEGSRSAFREYARRSSQAVNDLEPARPLLDHLVSLTGRLCPLKCEVDMLAQGDRCVAKGNTIQPKTTQPNRIAMPQKQAERPSNDYGLVSCDTREFHRLGTNCIRSDGAVCTFGGGLNGIRTVGECKKF